jgi:hypothetical protein
MAKRMTDADVVEQILKEMEGKKNRIKADEIVRVLGKRIRQRARDREDFSQAAFRIVRETTEKTSTEPARSAVGRTSPR